MADRIASARPGPSTLYRLINRRASDALAAIFGSFWPLRIQDDDSYGEDEFDKSEGGGGGRNSPGRERGGGGGEFRGGRVPCEASEWPMSKRTKGLNTLKRLSKANR